MRIFKFGLAVLLAFLGVVLAPQAAFAAPSTPGNPSATAGDTQVTINWAASTPDSGQSITYFVQCQVGIGGPLCGGSYATAQQQTTGTSLVWTGLTSGDTYAFIIQARQGNGINSTWTSPVTATPTGPPDAPTGLTATPGDGTVNLSWTAPTNPPATAPTRYNVKYSADGNFWSAIGIYNTATTYQVTGLTDGTTYTFEVSATNASGDSDWSQAVTATPKHPVALALSYSTTPRWGVPVTVQVTATVPGSTHIPTGNVTLSGIPLATGQSSTVALDANGKASFVTSARVSPRVYSLSATYAGDAADATKSQVVAKTWVKGYTYEVNRLPKYSLIGRAERGPVYVKNKWATATTPIPTGRLTIFLGTRKIWSGRFINGVAHVWLPKLSKGIHRLKLVYSGNANQRSSVLVVRFTQR